MNSSVFLSVVAIVVALAITSPLCACAATSDGRLITSPESAPAQPAAVINDPALLHALTSTTYALLDDDQYIPAISNAAHTVDLFPNEPDAWFWLGRAYYHAEECSNAYAALCEALHRAPSNTSYLVECARMFHWLECYKAAAFFAAQALNIDSNCYDALLITAKILGSTRYTTRALEVLDVAETLSPSNAATWAARGSVLRSAKRYDEACAAYHTAIALDPSNTSYHVNLAYTHADARRYDLAVQAYSRALAMRSNDYHTIYNRGCAYSKLQLTDAAIADYKRALALCPSYMRAVNNLGVCYRNLRRYDDAIQQFTIVLSNYPDNEVAYYNLGLCYEALGNLPLAISNFTLAVAYAPDSTDAYMHRSVCYTDTRQYQAAIADLNRAIAILGDYADPWLYHFRAYNLILCRDYPAALADAQAAISRNYVKAHLLRGRAHAFLGNFHAALADYTNHLVTPYFDHGEHFYAGYALLGVSNYAAAIDHFSTSLASDPNFYHARLGRAAAYFYAGLFTNALDDITAYLKNDPTFTPAQHLLNLISNTFQPMPEVCAASAVRAAQHPTNTWKIPFWPRVLPH